MLSPSDDAAPVRIAGLAAPLDRVEYDLMTIDGSVVTFVATPTQNVGFGLEADTLPSGRHHFVVFVRAWPRFADRNRIDSQPLCLADGGTPPVMETDALKSMHRVGQGERLGLQVMGHDRHVAWSTTVSA